jgi:hypothetical protein
MPAMILIWLVGVVGVNTGCQGALIINSGSVPDDQAILESIKGRTDHAAGNEYTNAVITRALIEHRDRTLPLSVGQALLSLLLVSASAMILSGRPGARTFALQVFGANAVFYVVDYVLTQDFRDQWVRARAQLDDAAVLGLAPVSLYVWVNRVGLAFHLMVSAGGILTLFSKRTLAYLDASERAEQRREREDEP